ncbi:hypothetical protein GRS48_06145 [Halorubrum sp. JWXQ-INN 858]|uniref:hypothetical protein n=1 Tax=Halorubrum sp. JWXQ-INN 858 TaxID=2690782 RepID=UPI001359315B|nr:hypothetical protein [Halorubrum sp. JWXQ-INN 858]MWV64405.1 hypothetical protein [Halorubrum sp. JWXQ-INN 858]
MTISPADVERYAAEYRAEEPLYPVEREAIESLPAALRAGEYGPRDAEWIVRWYFRRHLGAYPDAERRAVEERFAGADRREMKAAIADAIAAVDGTTAAGETEADGGDATDGTEADGGDLDAALAALTRLPGVDVCVASAFLWFIDPDRYPVVGAHEWAVIAEHTDLDPTYPDPVTAADYGRFRSASRGLERRLETDIWGLYRAIRRIDADRIPDRIRR